MKVTLQTIAARLNVAPSTVQRALSGNAGVSSERRNAIRRVAEEMGYIPNFHASSLKRGTKRIAAILPDTDTANRYFAAYLWKGIHQHATEVSTLNLEILECPYSISPDEHLQVVEKVARGEYGSIDGIITRGTTGAKLEGTLASLHDKGIPIALIGSDIASQKRLYCVKNYEEMQGKIAADLLIQFGSIRKQRKIIVCGNFSGLDQYNNARGFERRIWESKLPIDILMVSYVDDPSMAIPTIQKELESNSPVYAIYACSTRGTVAVADLLEKTGAYRHVRAIGSDVFQESISFLRKGVLRALLDSRPTEMAYQAARKLTSHLRQPGLCTEPHTQFIEPSVVFPSNLPEEK